MEDALTYARKIIQLSDMIEELVSHLEDFATEKARAKADYAREVGITILKLKNGLITEFEGNEIKNLTAGERQTIAEAICYREVFDKDNTDNQYKALTTKIDARKAQMNGYQSINKVLQ